MTEEDASKDLAIKHYPGKWRQAQTLGHDRRNYAGSYVDFDYWSRVRALYLELGGLFVGQLHPIQKLTYAIKQETAHHV